MHLDSELMSKHCAIHAKLGEYGAVRKRHLSLIPWPL